MSVQKVTLAGVAAALLGSAVAAQAGGFERSEQDFDILFEPGNAVETGATYVMPDRKIKNIRGSYIAGQTGGVNPLTGKPYETSVNEGQGYWVPKASAKFQITDDLACAAQYRQPWGIHTDVGMDTARMYTAIEQKISSNDYGLNCSYRFAAGEKGYFRLLGGVSYQELRGEQTRLIPPGTAFGGTFRVGSLNVDDHSFGWRVGAAYEIPEYALRATLVYQSAVKYSLDGTVGNLAPVPIDVTGDVSAPQSVEFKFQTGVAPGWLVFGSAKWTDWSSIENVAFNASNSRVAPAGTNITNLNLYYRDGWTLSGGVGHKFNEQWSGAATLTWDRGTSTGLTSQTDVWLFGLAANYKPMENLEFRLAGALGWLSSGEINDTVVAGQPNPSGSKGDFGNDLVSAISLTTKIRF